MFDMKNIYHLLSRWVLLMLMVAPSTIFAQDPPEEFSYEQSTLQAFYFFNEVTLNGVPIESDDWVAAFKGDVCVGARQWDVSACGGGICDVPAMGYDGYESTQGYMESGDIPIFKVYDASTGGIYPAFPSEDVLSWSVNGFSMTPLLEAEEVVIEGCMDNTACNYDSTATIECSDCCVYIQDGECDCDGSIDLGCGCGEPAAEEYYDCQGNCVNDSDGDEVCDELEIAGCMDDTACNFNENATEEDGSCEYPEENYDCDGNCTVVIDECGVCGGSGVPDGQCDCVGSPEIEHCHDWDGDGLGAGSPQLYCENSPPENWVSNCDDIMPYCFENYEDDCGMCGGDNYCEGEVNNGSCDGEFSGSNFDCAGFCGGTAEEDECGVCQGDNSTCLDCAGVPNGAAEIDDCGDCSGGTTGHESNSSMDECGVCFGDGTSCTLGCTDPEANNYYCLEFTCESGELPEELAEDGSCVYNYNGTITYFSDLTLGVNNVTVSLFGMADNGEWQSHTIFTNSDGDYIFQDIPMGYYTITPQLFGNSTDGISTTDATLLARSIIGLEELEFENASIAANVDLNEYINSVDASRITRYSVGLINTMNNDAQTWAFNPQEIIIEEINQFDLGTFKGIKLGDVNGGWGTSVLTRSIDRAEKLVYGNEITIPLKINALGQPIYGVDLEIEIPSNVEVSFQLLPNLSSELDYKVLENREENKFKIAVYSTGEISENISELGNFYFQFDEGWDTEEVSIRKININESYNNGGLLIDSNSLVQSVKFISKPQSFNLIGNSPNPFNPTTMIRWEQENTTNIKIDIYDIEGNFINTVTNMSYPQGKHSIQWDASTYPSGIYIYFLSSENDRLSGKMVLIK